MGTFQQAAEKYGRKLRAAQGKIASNWTAAKADMKQGYAAVGFGPQTTGNYNAGIDAAPAPQVDVEKAIRRWTARMSR